ncbi:peptidoglycan-binding domain-containing protein [Salipiger sp. 1_MG-2023]|uniref:peptidoglycan-binding domain-containing protein n=1 Tax=Salipiger sp. 1_MG-2023 TaxID=3062665 RepID=UPI0026E183A5|nr:peptidoglycan-binding protein [Salipiger sp. 1_MG-2023]MDO6586119.1 peptidoglycan-binding domain-containing protein [Salipiger sp. 1_MG-2023]
MKPCFIAALAAASVVVTPIQASADNAFVGGLVGGIIGSAIANQPKQRVYRAPARKTTTRKATSTVNTAQRQQNRDTQTALNYFGFDAGSVDGVMGSRSRRAISGYQSTMGYSPTGQLTQYERDFLIGSYHRAQAGGPTTAQMIASSPLGVKGLLVAYRDEQMNGGGTSSTASIGGHYGLPSIVAAAVNEIAKSSDPTAEQLVQRSGFIQLSDINGDGRTDYVIDTSVTGSAFWCNAQSCAVRVFASTPDGYERNDFQAFNVTPAMFNCQRGSCAKIDDGAPQMAAAITPAPMPAPEPVPMPKFAAAPEAAIPNFFQSEPVAASLSSHCNTVSLVTSTNGGYITEATLADANEAMAEQLCLTRSYALSSGEALMSQIRGATPQQVAEQCASFGTLLRDSVSAVSLQSDGDVMKGVGQFVLSTGIAPAQLSRTAQICLASGYRSDDLETAMAAALMLVSLGQAPYAEIIGHHLSQGFGATRRSDLAIGWYARALDALESGATPVFGPGQPERAGLLRKASLMLGGNAAASAPTVTQASVPVFSIEN